MDELQKGTIVELRAGPDALYQRASAGSQGIVRDRKLDDYDYPMVYVEWDRNDWRYQGQPDGWVFESHFRPVTDGVEGGPNLDAFLKPGPSSDILRKAYERAEKEEVPDEMQAHIDAMDQAINVLTESDSFLLICTKKIDSEEHGTIIAPAVINGSTDPESGLALEAQVSQIAAAMAHENTMMLMAINRRMREEEENDESGQ